MLSVLSELKGSDVALVPFENGLALECGHVPDLNRLVILVSCSHEDLLPNEVSLRVQWHGLDLLYDTRMRLYVTDHLHCVQIPYFQVSHRSGVEHISN